MPTPSTRVLLLAALPVLAAPLAAAQPTVTTAVNNGPSSNRVDFIAIGDGYTAGEISTTYAQHTTDLVSYFFQNGEAPLTRYEPFVNVHRVNVVSNQSGADDPANGIERDTALNASYNWGGSVDRCLYFSTSLANQAVNTALAGTGIDVDVRIGMVNSQKYGGCGGQWGVYSAGNGGATEIALHEIGHSWVNLADEYTYGGPETYTGGEFGSRNVTNNPNSGKWDRWVGYDDPSTDIGPIGYYEGGRYSVNGVWRPSDNSKMRALGRPFDAISREAIIQRIYQEVDPLDGWLDNSETLVDPDTLWVDTVSDDVIAVRWFVNGELTSVTGASVTIEQLGLGIGDHEVAAYAFDTALSEAGSGSALDLVRDPAIQALMQQTVGWDITVVPEPAVGSLALLALLGVRRRRAA